MPTKSQSRAAAVANKRTAHPPEPLPKWPALQPLVPTSDLALETVLEDQIVVIRNLFTSVLCRDYVSFLSSLPLTTTPGHPKKGDAVRVNDRIQFDDYAFAERLWASTGLKDLVTGAISPGDEGGLTFEERRKLWGGQVCGLNPRIRIYRYVKGQFFDQHCKPTTSINTANVLPSNCLLCRCNIQSLPRVCERKTFHIAQCWPSFPILKQLCFEQLE